MGRLSRHHPAVRGHDDDRELAAWMLELVDESPNRLAIIELPETDPGDDLDALEDATLRAFEVAKEGRPELTAKTAMGVHASTGERRLLLFLHEHEWVGAQCIRGCGEQVESDE